MQITKVRLIVIVVLAIIFGSVINSLFGGESQKKEIVSPVVPTSVIAQPTSAPIPTEAPLSTWSQNDKQEYLLGCLGGGEASEAYCTCTLDIVEKKYTPSEARQLGSAYESTGQLPQEFIAIATACLHTL